LAFDIGSFIGGFVVGGIAGMVFLGFKGITALGKASEMGWINQAEIEKDLKSASMARAYSARARRRSYRTRAYPARAIYGHGVGVESDLNRIPIYLG
jgi:hypothetical protein